MGSTHPYYRSRARGPYHVVIGKYSDGSHVDLRYVHGDLNTVDEAALRFDARTAEFVRASVGDLPRIEIFPDAQDPARWPALLELQKLNTGDINIPSPRCLAALAYLEFFPYDHSDTARFLRAKVSNAILRAEPGYCGTFGAPSEAAASGLMLAFSAFVDTSSAGQGNYDLTQMHLLQIAYRYYDDLDPAAQDLLINVLLATGRIHRPGQDDIVTSGGAPNDWARAGHIEFLSHVFRIGETENHILQIHTARYLTNQLLYQRDPTRDHDNRRNGTGDSPTCMNLMLDLLRNFLMDDFSEYNAKSYQTETRNALRNLCSYAYDHEVRLAARMVLDYLSARVATSSCDLRRLVPFRRINEGKNTTLIDGSRLDVSLLEWETGADRASEPFAVQAGNLRAYETHPSAGPVWKPDVWRDRSWSIRGEGNDGMMEGLGEYRLPPSIHDLFMNDKHRRFFQRLRRRDTGDVRTGQNAENMEIFAGSPSYLISAGGGLAGEAINPGVAAAFDPSLRRKQLGVAMTTSFMPTGQSADANGLHYARDLIQLSSFAEEGQSPLGNYGVAPDFACGHWVWLPEWCQKSIDRSKDKANEHGVFSFVNKRGDSGPGFFLAIYQDRRNLFSVMEAYDTWLHPELDFDHFVNRVWWTNRNLHLRNHVESDYRTINGNQMRFVIWFDRNDDDTENFSFGAEIVQLTYGDDPRDFNDRIGDASKVSGFLNGTVLNSAGDGLIEVGNPSLRQSITLDMRDPRFPRRVSETGEVEQAGFHNEVYVNFDSDKPEEGDFFHPFKTLAGATATVDPGGIVKILPGSSRERPVLSKRCTLQAAIGGVVIGKR